MAKEPETTLSKDPSSGQASLQSSIRTQWLSLAIALAVLATVIGYENFTSYRGITNQEQRRLQTQARVIALNIEHQFNSTKLALTSVLKDLAFLRRHDNIKLANRRLQTFTDAMPGVRTMLILDKNGVVSASNREDFVGKDFSARDYYQTPLHRNDNTLLYVSPPFKSILGVTVLNLTRIISASDGTFDGIVVAALDPKYFKVLLNSVLYASDMLSAINHSDGIRFMMVPNQEGQPGKNLAQPGTFTSRHRESGNIESILTGKSPSYDSVLVTAIRTVQPPELKMDKALYVACSRDQAAIYADWRAGVLKQALIFVLFCTVSCLGLALLQRRQRRWDLLATRTRELTSVRMRLVEYSVTHNLQELLKHALDEICELSNSPIGFYHFVASDQKTISLQAWSTRTLAEFCTADGNGQHYPIENAGVWADCVRQRRPIIQNDYASLPNRKGLPAGHAPVIRELVVPIFRAERVVAILGIGNKPTDYTDQDIELVTFLADVGWEITERKRNEEERLSMGIRYQTLQSVASDGIHILDQDGNLVESNAAFRKMLGYSAEEELRINVAEWDACTPPEELPAKIREHVKTPDLFETRHRRRDGSVFDVEINSCGVKLDGTWYLYASSRDISKRKEMEASLRESRQLQADIFDFLPDATFVVDIEKRVIAWNRAMEEMSGVSKENMMGQGDHAYTIPFYGDRRDHLLDLVDVDDEELKAKYKKVTRQGERLYGEAFCPELYNGKGAHIWAVVSPLYDSDRKRIGAIESIRDITTLKEIETNLARSNSELEQFAYVASHDLQEPLRKIAGFTELLANRYKGTFDEKAESYMAYIVDGSTRMRSLINDLLSYSRVMRSTKELVETDTAKVIARVLRDLELAIKDSDTEIICGPLPVINADQTQLGQLFQNLIGNAIKYRGEAPPRIVINAVRERNDWLFSVIDNGIGIAPEFYERIFAIFQRLHTRTEYPGTGIGLAVCQKIVERHGGRIWLESELGTGSTFFFTIPTNSSDLEIN